MCSRNRKDKRPICRCSGYNFPHKKGWGKCRANDVCGCVKVRDPHGTGDFNHVVFETAGCRVHG